MDSPREAKEDALKRDFETLVSEEPDWGQTKVRAREGHMLVAGEFCEPAHLTKLKKDSVSGYVETRDSLRALVRNHLEEKVELVEADFQPSRR